MYWWQDDARCRRDDVNPEWWFPIGETSSEAKRHAEKAKKLCNEYCIVKAECYEFWLSVRPLSDGIWAGTTREEFLRAQKREARARQATAAGINPVEAREFVPIEPSADKIAAAIARGWTIRQLAERVGVHESTIVSVSQRRHRKVMKLTSIQIKEADLTGPPGGRAWPEDVLIGSVL